MHGLTRYLLSGAVVLIAVGALAVKYWDYLSNPWTRAGQVRANVIQVATRVSGPIVELPIRGKTIQIIVFGANVTNSPGAPNERVVSAIIFRTKSPFLCHVEPGAGQ